MSALITNNTGRVVMDSVVNQIHHRSCNLCEAICGLEIEHDGERVIKIKGDADDPLSQGHICPKAVALQDIHSDPNRLTRPQKRVGNQWEEISWELAFEEISQRLNQIRHQHGANSVGVYLGNPTVHNYGTMTALPFLLKSLSSHNIFTATSVDQLPHHVAASFMFGHSLLIPVPDVDRAEYMLILGANPGASNGSIMTAPGIRRRLEAIRKRGGKIILIDPRATETEALVDQLHFIRPGSDVWLLAAILQVIFDEHLDDVGTNSKHLINLDLLKTATGEITPESAADYTGIDAGSIRELAREFTSAKSAVCYGRMGLSTQAHGGLCQWLVNALNIVTGNFDRAGGVMFTRPAVDLVGGSNTIKKFGRWHSRVRGLPEFNGQLPVAVLAEEILTPGEGQIRTLITNAGNPVLSTPNGRQMDEALDQLDLMVSVDIYLNETTRHADYILPPATGLETDHYDLIFNLLTVRNYAKYSPRLFEPAKGSRYDWQILHALVRGIKHPSATWFFRFKQSVINSALKFATPARLLNLGLMIGPYGTIRRAFSLARGLNLRRLKQHPHGMDLGALEPRIPQLLRTLDKKINLAPAVMIKRWEELLESESDDQVSCEISANSFLLIGRRHLRSNNSWMHNSHRLVKGKNRCTLMIHTSDAKKLGFQNEKPIRVTSSVGSIELPLEITDDIMPGVVSIPHGYGHNRKGTRLDVAEAHAGASINDLTDDQTVDLLTGNAAFSGQLVELFSPSDSSAE